jgi:hypothetical protein
VDLLDSVRHLVEVQIVLFAEDLLLAVDLLVLALPAVD